VARSSNYGAPRASFPWPQTVPLASPAKATADPAGGGELFSQSFAEMKSLTSLPIFISETDLAPLSTSQDCNGGSSYQTITSFIADLFSAGGGRDPPVPGRNPGPDQRPVDRA
jgi:hypothetical protein